MEIYSEGNYHIDIHSLGDEHVQEANDDMDSSGLREEEGSTNQILKIGCVKEDIIWLNEEGSKGEVVDSQEKAAMEAEDLDIIWLNEKGSRGEVADSQEKATMKAEDLDITRLNEEGSRRKMANSQEKAAVEAEDLVEIMQDSFPSQAFVLNHDATPKLQKSNSIESLGLDDGKRKEPNFGPINGPSSNPTIPHQIFIVERGDNSKKEL
ncbi:hypothetical protein SLA2020_059280 [Shorea laevis]